LFLGISFFDEPSAQMREICILYARDHQNSHFKVGTFCFGFEGSRAETGELE
jgi:hypothetical protein